MLGLVWFSTMPAGISSTDTMRRIPAWCDPMAWPWFKPPTQVTWLLLYNFKSKKMPNSEHCINKREEA